MKDWQPTSILGAILREVGCFASWIGGMVHLWAEIGLHFHLDRKFFKMQYSVHCAQLGTFRVPKWLLKAFSCFSSLSRVLDDTSPCYFKKQSVNQLVNHPGSGYGVLQPTSPTLGAGLSQPGSL